jgi:hypothetical protein
LVLNLVLVRLGHPPAIVYKRQRAEYLRIASSYRRSPVRRDSFRSPHWPTIESVPTRCARLRSADVCRRHAGATANGAARAIGWTTTSAPGTAGADPSSRMDRTP